MASQHRIAGFDGLRAVAFLLVFFSHKIPRSELGPFADVGVWTFFVLSGFLITRILADSRADVEAGETSAMSALRRFYARRFSRIFPVYYLVLATTLIASVFTTVEYFWGVAKLSYITYTTNYFIARLDVWVGDFGHLWTLAVEEQFYILFAPIILLAPRRWTGTICLAFVAAALAGKITMELAGVRRIAIEVSSLINFGLLGLGGVVGLAALRPAPAWLTGSRAQLAVAAALLATPLAFDGRTEAWLVYARLLTLVAGVLVFQIARDQGTPLVAVLEAPPIRLLGRVSYGAYLMHNFIHFKTLQAMLGPAAENWKPALSVQVLAELAITVALATLSWTLVERPILNWTRRTTGRPSLRPSFGAAPRAPL